MATRVCLRYIFNDTDKMSDLVNTLFGAGIPTLSFQSRVIAIFVLKLVSMETSVGRSKFQYHH